MTRCSTAARWGLVLAVLACSREAPQTRPAESPTPASGPASKGRPMKHPACVDQFTTFDDDGDGRITWEEYAAGPHGDQNAAAAFRERDQDGNGSLDPDEFCSRWQGAPEAGRFLPGAGGGSGRP